MNIQKESIKPKKIPLHLIIGLIAICYLLLIQISCSTQKASMSPPESNLRTTCLN